jgi:DNA-binding MarR family transcriptional regulator
MTTRSKPHSTAPKNKAPRDSNADISESTRRILEDFRLEEITSHLLRRAHFAAEEMFAQEFAEESITPRQKAALVVLHQNPGIGQNALADKLFMDRNTVAEMVKRMTTTGLMSRRPSPKDQRAYELFLASDGAALLDRVMPRDVMLEQKVLERLPAEYRPLFMKCLRLIIDQNAGEDSAATPESAPTKASSKRKGANL